MSNFIIVWSLTLVLSVVFILTTWRYRSYLSNIYKTVEKEEKEKSLDQLLDKYVVEEKKDIMKEKLSRISQIIEDTEKEIEKTVKTKVKVAKASIKAKGKELETITQAENEYITHSAGFTSAWPVTEEERKQDMAELENVISMLEELDEESYRLEPKKVDAGVGMFYDRMSTNFKKIIAEHNLDENKFIPIQRLKYHIFQDIKNIKNEDILPILKVMKDTKLLQDILEINPQFHLIVFSEEPIKLSLKEKVLLTFAYDEDYLSFQKLLDLTEWKENYAKKILNDLTKKEIVKFLDENITAEGFGHVEQRKKWNELIDKQITEEKEKAEQKRRRQAERQRMMKERLAKVEKEKAAPIKEIVPVEEKSPEELLDSLDDISATDEEAPKIKFEKKPAVKTLPLPSEKPSKKEEKEAKPEKKEIKKSKVEEDLIGALEALDEMGEGESEPKISKKKDMEVPDLTAEIEDLEDEVPELQDLIPEKILQYHEKFFLMNGGLVQYDLLFDYVKEELKDQDEIPEDLFKAMLNQLKDLGMIHSSMEMAKQEFFLFDKVMLSPLNKQLIEFAVGKKPLTKEEFMEGLDWPEKRATISINYLEKKNILKIEDGKVIFPGMIQKK